MDKIAEPFCAEHNITEAQYYGKEKIEGDLDLRGLTSIPEGFNPTVGGDLVLRGLTSIPESFNPTVGGCLDLESLTSIPEGFNPTVGGGLFLESLTSISGGFNPTVGGYLILRSLTSIPEDFNFKATDEKGVYHGNMTQSIVISWQNGRYRLIDKIFCEVISTHKNIIKAKRITSTEHFYIVTDGVNFSHGTTIREAQADLIYKISDIDTSIFKAWTLDTVVTLKDTIHSYRAITGACDMGVKMFVESLAEVPQQISVHKIIELVQGKYGCEAYRDFLRDNEWTR